jgi:hypothetical protein
MAEPKAPKAKKTVARKTNSDILNEFYQKYNLSLESDIHEQKTKAGKLMFRIITRSGIEKIQAGARISVRHELIPPHMYHPLTKMEVVHYSKDGDNLTKSQQAIPEYQVVVKTIGVMKDENGEIVQEVETFGEANVDNCRNADYLFAMAEKRGLSRAVLKLAGMYAYGFFGEDEADDFADTVKNGRNAAKTEG